MIVFIFLDTFDGEQNATRDRGGNAFITAGRVRICYRDAVADDNCQMSCAGSVAQDQLAQH